MLVFQPAIKHRISTVTVPSPNHCTAREFPRQTFSFIRQNWVCEHLRLDILTGHVNRGRQNDSNKLCLVLCHNLRIYLQIRWYILESFKLTVNRGIKRSRWANTLINTEAIWWFHRGLFYYSVHFYACSNFFIMKVFRNTCNVKGNIQCIDAMLMWLQLSKTISWRFIITCTKEQNRNRQIEF